MQPAHLPPKGMLLRGLCGTWMGSRGRTPRAMVLSVMGLASLAFLALVGLALL